jgi:hypothetical protein
VSLPAAGDVWTGWSGGFIGPMMATVVMQPVIFFASLITSTSQLVQRRIRNHKILFWTLLTSMALVVASFVILHIPAGASISGWIMD